MTQKFSLSLPTAILLNINIMLGTGIFINTVEVARRAGAFGFASYLLIGLLMLPLVVSFAYLVRIYPAGGFYAFASQELHPSIGFVSAWSYFIAKMASAALMVHVSMSLLQCLLPVFFAVPTLVLDVAILSLFTILNLYGLRTGGAVQIFFIVLKVIPLLFVMLAGAYVVAGKPFEVVMLNWKGVIATLPLVLYVTLGFEATCSISNSMENASRNGPRAIIISYGIVMFIVCLYQFLFFAGVGNELMAQENYLSAFPLLIQAVVGRYQTIFSTLAGVLHIAIALSALGGCYGIMFSNNWNLFTLAQQGHVVMPRVFTWRNAYAVPAACIIVQGVLSVGYLMLTGGSQIPLQQLSALGSVIAYSISIIALLSALKRLQARTWMQAISVCAVINCLILIIACIRNFIVFGSAPLIAFLGLVAVGILMFCYKNYCRAGLA